MFGYSYYHGTFRKYVIYFGTIFNSIFVNRVDSSNNVIQTIRVPITYGPKDKVLSRVATDPQLNRPFSSILPYISFEVTGMKFDEVRHLNNINYHIGKNSTNKNLAPFTYNPATYNLNFELNIMVKNLEDGLRIVEQILPFFQPDWTATLRLIDNPDIRRDIPIVLNNITTTDTWTGDYNERRVITYKLDFIMKALFYGPVNNQRIIKQANINFGANTNDTFTGAAAGVPHIQVGANTGATYVEDTVTVTPGLTANGTPTNNTALTIPFQDINWDDNYDFIIQTKMSNIYGQLE